MNIVLTWKNALYQGAFSKEQRMLVPENSAGMLNLTDEDLANVQGGDGSDPSGVAGYYADNGTDTVTTLSGSTLSELGNTFNNLAALLSD